ncbi:MAG: AraC family transcriptional regulator [Eubacterium sp.]|nr:AraC family transcriptional regulator [Eubacterium sp.]
MNYIQGLQNAIDYIEEHLTEELEIEVVAAQSGLSTFYFQRIFNILCDFSIGEYIRNRRLTLAGNELSSTDARVIDIALKYGYDTPESFARAFSKFHGITPSQAKKNSSTLKSFSRLSVEINLKGGSIMNYRIVKKEAFKVLEKVSKQSIDDEQNKNTIPDFWTQSHQDGTVNKLLELTTDKTNIFGVCYGNTPNNKKTFDYSIAALYEDGTQVPDGFRVNEIPARTWAVFECIGPMPDAVQQTWHKICAEFFPTAKYKPTYEMDIEAYPAGVMSSPDYKSEIWVVVEEK